MLTLSKTLRSNILLALSAILVGNMLLSLPAAAQQPAPMDQFPKVVALVNGQTISRDFLAQECLKRYGTIVLDNLMNKHLIIQACEAKGIKITQQDVNEEIERVANKVGLTTKLFLDALEEERDISPEQYASEIVWPMLALRALAADQIQVKPEEIDQVVESTYGPRVLVRMIAVSSRTKADQLYQAATAAPETFRRLAKEHSEDPASASVEGLLPQIRHTAQPDQLEKIAFQMQPNQISPVFQVGEMNLLLQCVKHVPGSSPTPQMLPMIRERIAEQLRDQRLGEAADGIFANLQETSQIVNVVGNKELEKKYQGVAGYINGTPVPLTTLAAECVARHGKEILRGEISRFLLTSELKKAGKSVEQTDMDREVARAAETAGFLRPDGQADINGWYQSILKEEGATIELYLSDAVWPSVALKKLVEDTVEITQEDLQKGFENNYGPRAEVLAVVLADQRTAQNVFAEARTAIKNRGGEQAFGEIAAKYSVEPVSRSNFGKIPPIRKHSGRPLLEETAFELEPGEVSAVLAWGNQFAILYKQGTTEPIVQEFEAVREELVREITESKLRFAMGRHMDKLLKEAQIDNFLDGETQAGKVTTASGTGSSASSVQPAVSR
ncbi:MAG: peptidylprolyl isomerase [Aureliella sp.]